MASAKIATLLIRTLAKPISNQIKQQAKEHETFRNLCVSLAQRMYRAEVRLRTNLLGETPKHIRPLSEAKAIENGANTLAEGFLFSVAALLIIGESWRSSRSTAKRRDAVDDTLEELQGQVRSLSSSIEQMRGEFEARWVEERQRNDRLTETLGHVVDVGMRAGLSELRDTPLRIPQEQPEMPAVHGADSGSATVHFPQT